MDALFVFMMTAVWHTSITFSQLGSLDRLPHEHLARVRTAEQPENRRRDLIKPLQDRVLIVQLALRQPAAEGGRRVRELLRGEGACPHHG